MTVDEIELRQDALSFKRGVLSALIDKFNDEWNSFNQDRNQFIDQNPMTAWFLGWEKEQ